jgi:peptidoglycan/xylan/chitin deacetylase (PgdA/CDA1 family)
MTHPNLSQLSIDDPSGEQLRAELDGCNDIIEKQLGVRPKDFAYTGTTFSTAAENEVRKRYRFGRLWIVGSAYRSDGNETRFADLVGVDAPDEADGGPPMAARYITRDYPAHRLPGVEIQGLIYEPNAFRRYLQGALG